MKIAEVCPYDIDRPGGVQAHVLDLAAAFVALGHDAVIIAPDVGVYPPRPASGGVRIVRIGRARKIHFGATAYEISIALGEERRALRRLMAESGFEVVHYHTMWTPAVVPQAFFAARAPAVATFHDTTTDMLSGRFLRAIFRLVSRFLLPRLDAVITPSDGPKDNLVMPAGRSITVLPPTTDLRRFMADTAPDTRLRDGKINILFLGRLEPRKGAKILLEAYRRLAGEGLAVRLLLAGSGEEEGALRRAVAEQAIPDVVFLGHVPDSETPKLYATCDIFCAPSPYGESFGIVVAEAMASGKPVVAAANRGYSTLLTGAAARFLTPPGNTDAIYRALRELAGDAALRERLGIWGRAQALRYDCNTLASAYLAVFDEAIARFKSRSAT